MNSPHQRCPECGGLLPHEHVRAGDWMSEIGLKQERSFRTILLYCQHCECGVEAVQEFGRPGYVRIQHWHNAKDLARVRRALGVQKGRHVSEAA